MTRSPKDPPVKDIMLKTFDIKTQNRSAVLRAIDIHGALFILLSLFYFVFAFHLYYTTKGFPGFTETNVDEIYFTYLAAFNYHYFGPLNSLFLPDYASGIDSAAHPYIYTHNIAFPNLVGYILMLLGLTKLEHFSFVSIFLSYIGYSTGYFFFRKYVGRGIAIVLFFMIVVNYQDVLTHSLSFFRPFQWILFFAVPYIFLEWSKQPKSNFKTALLFFSLLFAVSYEYTFAFKLYILLMLLFIFNVHNCRTLISLPRLLLIMMLAGIIPKSFQFIMMWGIFGLETAIYDNFVTLANRMLPAKDTQQLVNYYSERGILFWVYGDKPGLVEGVKSLSKSIVASYGIIPVVSALAVVFLHFVANEKLNILNILKEKIRLKENIKRDEVEVHIHIGDSIRLIIPNKEHRIVDVVGKLVLLFTDRIRKLNFVKHPLVVHIISVWISLSVAYQNYNWWIRHRVGVPVSSDIKTAIKATFPWVILLFITLYLIITLWKNKKITYLSVMQYAMLFISQFVLINIIFYGSEGNIRIIQNISIIYLPILLFIVNILRNDTVKKSISNKSSKMINIIRDEARILTPSDSIALISCMILSFSIYSIIFYAHVQMVNIGSHVPLVEMYTISATSLVIYLVCQFILKKTGSIYLCILIIFTIFYMQSTKFIYDYYRNPPVPMAAYDVLPKYKGKSFVTSYHSVYPTIFTNSWAISNWQAIVTPENITKYPNDGYIWLKDKNASPEKQKEYSTPEYYLHICRERTPSVDVRMKDIYKIVEKGSNYEIYKLR